MKLYFKILKSKKAILDKVFVNNLIHDGNLLREFIYSELESIDLIIKSENNLITKEDNIRIFPTYNKSVIDLISLVDSKSVCKIIYNKV